MPRLLPVSSVAGAVSIPVTSSVEVLEGSPSREIRHYVESNAADLLIMGSGEHASMGWIVGSTAHSVLQGVACDTLIIRQRNAPAH